MKHAITALVVFALIAISVGGCYLYMGGWLMIDPRYEESKLLGLTSAELFSASVSRFYPRVIRGASTQPGWQSEAENGPLSLGYYQNLGTCVITFKDDRVVEVRRFWK